MTSPLSFLMVIIYLLFPLNRPSSSFTIFTDRLKEQAFGLRRRSLLFLCLMVHQFNSDFYYCLIPHILGSFSWFLKVDTEVIDLKPFFFSNR